MSQRILAPGALLIGALAILAGCSDSSSPNGSTSLLTSAQVQDLGQDVAEDAAEMADASGYTTGTGLYLGAAVSGARVNTPPPACVAISPLPPANSDGDLVPDSVRFTYNQCGFSRAGGNILDSLSGVIDFIDPLPNQTSVGARHVYTDFTRKRVNLPFPRRSYTVVRNGTREWGGDADTLGHTITHFVSVWTHASGRTTTHEKNWVGRFTAEVPGTIALGVPLPAGTWTLNGASTWTTENRSWSVQVTTAQPLHYDPACQVTPRFTSGTLDLVVTRNGDVTDIEIAFTACGQYQVTRTVGAGI
jgi:hypothetical protein